MTVPARAALRIATLGGAEAIHHEGRIGSLQIGKRADIILVSTNAIHMTPTHDAVGGLVLNARPDDVDTVIVDGRLVKQNGELLHVDWPRLRERFMASAERIIAGYRAADGAEAMRANERRHGNLQLG